MTYGQVSPDKQCNVDTEHRAWYYCPCSRQGKRHRHSAYDSGRDRVGSKAPQGTSTAASTSLVERCSSICSRACVSLPTSALQCQRASPSLAAAGCLAWRVLPAYMSASSLKAFILRNEVVGLYRNFLKAVRKAPEHIRGMSWLRS